MTKIGARFLAVLTLALLSALPAGAQPYPAQPVPAQPPPAAAPAGMREFHIVGRLGLDGGGATIEKVTMSDGSSEKLTAGGLVGFSAGLVYTPVATPLVVEATIGYKMDSVNASNGELTFDRWPLEVLASYRVERHRIGGGLALHMSPTYSCEVDAQCSFSSSGDDALGGILQYAYGDYTGGFVWDFGLRVTLINYKAPSGANFNGNSFGGFFSFGY